MWSVFLGSFTTFLGSTSLTWSSSALPKLNSTFSPLGRLINEQEGTWLASILPLGCCLGSWIFCQLANVIGRKITLLLIGVIYLSCNVVIALARTIELFYVARFFIGCALSGSFFLTPLYTIEIVHVSKVIIFGTMISICACGGLFYSNLIGPFVSISVNNGMLVIISALFLVSFSLLGKESPVYYQQIKGFNQKTSLDNDDDYNFFSIFTNKSLRKGFICVNALLFFSQLSGIDVVIFYGQKIFEDFNTGITPQISMIILGAFHFCSSFFLLVLSKYNKKTLLMISGIGMLFSDFCLAVLSFIITKYNLSNIYNILSLIFLIFYILTYNIGFGPLPWFIVGEMFPSKIKMLATSLTSTLYWLTAFLVTKNVFTILDYIGLPLYFLFCCVNCFLAILFARFYLIETAGKTTEEIQMELKK